jgi:pimeloyl-ACP methyl ester carboxylesterase
VNFTTHELQVVSADGTALAGELVMPVPFGGALAVMQQGSTHADRDGNVPRVGMASSLYRRLSRMFAERGVATFRCDKRQFDWPPGTPLTYSFSDRVADLTAAVVTGAGFETVRGSPVVLVGHSEGGLVVQAAASAVARQLRGGGKLRGVAVLASPATTMLDSMEWRARNGIERGAGKPRDTGMAMLAARAEIRRRLDAEARGDRAASFTPESFMEFCDAQAKLGGLQGWESWPWIREHAALDVLKHARELPVPALYVHGDHDRIVDAANLDRYRAASQAAGRTADEFIALIGLGHYLEDSTRKAFVVSETLMDTVADWIARVTK